MRLFFKTVIIVQLILIAFLVFMLTGVWDWAQDKTVTYRGVVGSSANISGREGVLEKTKADRPENDIFVTSNVGLDDASPNSTLGFGRYRRSPQLTSPSQDNSFTVDLERIHTTSPLTPKEIYELDVNDNLWGYFADNEERFKQFRKLDKGISLVDYRGVEFKDSELAQYLKLSSKTRVYVFLEFVKPIGPEVFYHLRSLGFDTVPLLKREHYYKKHAGIFYVPYRKLKNIYGFTSIRNIYILAKYTATARYQLGIKSSQSTDSLEFKINYPYSKPGLKVSDLSYAFKGKEPFEERDNPERNQLIVTTPVTSGTPYLFTSEHRLEVDLLENLKRHLAVSARGVSLEQYRKEMKETPDLNTIFTRPGEKIVTSEYVNNIVRQINTEMDLSGIWKQITFILDKDIEYDWQKRELFFSGNLSYNNIKNMYLNVAELSEKKVGACTERTSLEIAILRELGVAARSATRVYHIFTEVYVPQKGWLTTSLVLNEIPLCHSYDENMAYFVEWNQEFPIRLKWVGKLKFDLLKDLIDSSELVRR